MDRALFLAERGRGRTSPNPVVGAVVVSDDGIVAGQGAHLEAGGPHAEIVALDRAGSRAAGATLYCTLEPCSHHGRTPPCVERVVAAGIRRVVFAARDPNPMVNGTGAAYLRARGIEVEEGVREAEAARQNAPFFRWVADRRPFVTIKAATSTDGFVSRPGERVQLTGAAADRYFHRQRAAIDAIAVGSGTVLIDDPLLTARGAYRHRPLTRVVFDWRGRVPASARVFSTLESGPVIMFMSAEAAEARAAHVRNLLASGVRVEACRARDLRAALATLADLGITWLLVEGGPALHTALVEAGTVDHVQWVIAPRTLDTGTRLGIVPLRSTGTDDAPRVTRLDDDVLVEFDVYRSDRSDRTH